VYAVLEGGTLDGQLVGVGKPGVVIADWIWEELRTRGYPLMISPDGAPIPPPEGSGYFLTDRTDAEGRPVLEWREAPKYRG
jgi:hypothetical protein